MENIFTKIIKFLQILIKLASQADLIAVSELYNLTNILLQYIKINF